METILPDLVEELATTDTEALCCLGTVAVAGEQGAVNCPSFHLGQQGAQGQRLGRVARHGNRRIIQLVGVEMLGEDRPAVCGDHCPLKDILQLSNISGPGALLDDRKSLGRDGKRAPAVPALDASQDVLGQGPDVLGAVAERRNHDPRDVEAVEEILAETAGGNLPGQVAVRGRDDSGVGVKRLGPAEALEFALLEDAQDLGL